MQAYRLKIVRPKIDGGPRPATTVVMGLPKPPMTVETMRRLVEAERVIEEVTGLRVSIEEPTT